MVGIVCGIFGADIVLTDQPMLVKLINFNISENVPNKSVRAASYMWGLPPTSEVGDAFDVIIGSDLTYDFNDLPLVLSALKALSSTNTEIFIAYGRGDNHKKPNSWKRWIISQPKVVTFCLTIAYLSKWASERAATPTFLELASIDFNIEHIP